MKFELYTDVTLRCDVRSIVSAAATSRNWWTVTWPLTAQRDTPLKCSTRWATRLPSPASLPLSSKSFAKTKYSASARYYNGAGEGFPSVQP